MKRPVISVLMATYNHADYVSQAIDSVLSQRGVDLELVIADDGSSDRTREVVASIHDKRIRFFPSEINKGACTTTNHLIQKAEGEYIALINSDDYWIGDDKLSYQYHLMRENPNIGACFGRARFIDKYGRNIDKTAIPFGTVFDQKNRSRGQWLRYFFDMGNCICHPTMLIRKSCYTDVGTYNNRLRQLPDYDMWIRLIKRHNIFVSDRELINFRIMPGENASSQTTSNSIRTINEHYIIASKYFDDVDRELLIDGFGDLLKHKEIPTDMHLDIEKVLLYFNKNEWLGKPYKMIGLLKMSNLLADSRYNEALTNLYAIDDKWFHMQSGEIDVLRPKFTAAMGQTKSMLRGNWHQFLSRMVRN